ncbi:MAG TPA: proline dehydrogenase family protein [Planctomycetota bacterium]|jgi:proline dehydrogenase|nr:proline dehydrogenase family protein [Planctomycetota bacterium]
MPGLLDAAIVRALPLLPKPVVWKVARRYIAGTRREDALATVARLNAAGLVATVDLLGEHAADGAEADGAVEEYREVLREIARRALRSNISVKLTHFGLKIDPGGCERRMRGLLEEAARVGNFVRIDMEDSSCTDATLALYRRLRGDFENVGPVLQAYLRRTHEDARALLEGPSLNLRLCKGIYREPPGIALQAREEINRNFLRVLEELLRGGATVGCATHDEPLADEALAMVARLGVPKERFECQMLLGVAEALRDRLARGDRRVRIYIPYGSQWYAYSIRRLRENPRIARYVMRALFA